MVPLVEKLTWGSTERKTFVTDLNKTSLSLLKWNTILMAKTVFRDRVASYVTPNLIALDDLGISV